MRDRSWPFPHPYFRWTHLGLTMALLGLSALLVLSPPLVKLGAAAPEALPAIAQAPSDSLPINRISQRQIAEEVAGASLKDGFLVPSTCSLFSL